MLIGIPRDCRTRRMNNSLKCPCWIWHSLQNETCIRCAGLPDDCIQRMLPVRSRFSIRLGLLVKKIDFSVSSSTTCPYKVRKSHHCREEVVYLLHYLQQADFAVLQQDFRGLFVAYIRGLPSCRCWPCRSTRRNSPKTSQFDQEPGKKTEKNPACLQKPKTIIMIYKKCQKHENVIFCLGRLSLGDSPSGAQWCVLVDTNISYLPLHQSFSSNKANSTTWTLPRYSAQLQPSLHLPVNEHWLQQQKRDQER